MIPSSVGHEESCVNQGGPPSKAKYYLLTDSEQVPWGKGEKNPWRGVKENLKPYAYRKRERKWPRAFWLMCPWVAVYGEVKPLGEAEGKPSFNRAPVICGRPEARWATYVQDEAKVKLSGGPNR